MTKRIVRETYRRQEQAISKESTARTSSSGGPPLDKPVTGIVHKLNTS